MHCIRNCKLFQTVCTCIVARAAETELVSCHGSLRDRSFPCEFSCKNGFRGIQGQLPTGILAEAARAGGQVHIDLTQLAEVTVRVDQPGIGVGIGDAILPFVGEVALVVARTDHPKAGGTPKTTRVNQGETTSHDQPLRDSVSC